MHDFTARQLCELFIVRNWSRD